MFIDKLKNMSVKITDKDISYAFFYVQKCYHKLNYKIINDVNHFTYNNKSADFCIEKIHIYNIKLSIKTTRTLINYFKTCQKFIEMITNMFYSVSCSNDEKKINKKNNYKGEKNKEDKREWYKNINDHIGNDFFNVLKKYETAWNIINLSKERNKDNHFIKEFVTFIQFDTENYKILAYNIDGIHNKYNNFKDIEDLKNMCNHAYNIYKGIYERIIHNFNYCIPCFYKYKNKVSYGYAMLEHSNNITKIVNIKPVCIGFNEITGFLNGMYETNTYDCVLPIDINWYDTPINLSDYYIFNKKEFKCYINPQTGAFSLEKTYGHMYKIFIDEKNIENEVKNFIEIRIKTENIFNKINFIVKNIIPLNNFKIPKNIEYISNILNIKDIKKYSYPAQYQIFLLFIITKSKENFYKHYNEFNFDQPIDYTYKNLVINYGYLIETCSDSDNDDNNFIIDGSESDNELKDGK